MASNTTTSEDSQALLTPGSEVYDQFIKEVQDIRGAITKNYLRAVSKITEYIKVPEISKDYTEIGVSVFAVVNNMITCSACIVTVCWFILIVTQGTFHGYPYIARDLTKLAMVHTLSAIAFAFSLILLKGLFQKKPAYIKAYYVCGMTVVLIGLAQIIPVLFISGFSYSISYDSNVLMLQISLGVIWFSILYYVILSMVWATYKKMLEEQEGQNDEEQQKYEKQQKDVMQKDEQQKTEQQEDVQQKDEQQKNEKQNDGLQKDVPKEEPAKNAVIVETV